MCARRNAVRRFTQLALAAGLIVMGGAAAAKSDPVSAWSERAQHIADAEGTHRDRLPEFLRERRKRRAELRREFREGGAGEGRERGKGPKEIKERRRRMRQAELRRIRSWREPDPPGKWLNQVD